MKIIRFSGISAGCCLLPISLCLLSAIAWGAEPAAEQPARDPSQCELVVEGDQVERVFLCPAQGISGVNVQDLAVQSGVSIFLPPGNYTVQRIILHGGYQCYDNGTLTLAPNAPCKLEVGTPLKSSVNVTRQGRILRMEYQLCDAQGRKYASFDRSSPPRFVVYQGDRKIGSGTFEYG